MVFKLLGLLFEDESFKYEVPGDVISTSSFMLDSAQKMTLKGFYLKWCFKMIGHACGLILTFYKHPNNTVSQMKPVCTVHMNPRQGKWKKKKSFRSKISLQMTAGCTARNDLHPSCGGVVDVTLFQRTLASSIRLLCSLHFHSAQDRSAKLSVYTRGPYNYNISTFPSYEIILLSNEFCLNCNFPF